MTNVPGRRLPSARYLLLALIFSVMPMAGFITAAQAQAPDLSTDEVTVDLSVIDAPAAASIRTPAMATPGAPTLRRGLLLPGKTYPVSRLHVAVPKATGKIKLKKPGSRPKRAAKRVVKKKARIKQAATTRPVAPTVAATKPPAPLTTAPPVPPAVAPAPPPIVAAPKTMPQKTAKAPAPEKKTAAEPVAKKIIAAKVEKPAVKMPLPPKAAPPPAPAPVVKAEVKPEAAPEEKQQAALPPGPETTKTGQTLRVEFAANVSKLPATAKTGLLALAAKLKDNENLRLQLMAYAGGKSLSASNARRLSLSRALSVRSFLIEKGVRSTRIDVRALGNKTTETPPNRVDVNIVER